MKKTLLAALACAAICPAALASGPWDGTWKLDRAKSHLDGTTFTYSKAANGMWHFSDGTFAYDFGLDGKARPSWTPESTVRATADGDHAINYVYSMKGHDTSVHEVLSPDGNTLTDHATGKRPDGSDINDTTVMTRVGSGSGFMGTWKSSKSTSTSAGTYTIATNGNMIKWDIPEYKEIVNGKMDGSAIPITGDAPAGLTIAISTAGHTMDYKVRMNDKVIGIGHITMGADGKTMTEVSYSPAKPAEKTTALYVKQ